MGIKKAWKEVSKARDMKRRSERKAKRRQREGGK